MKRVLVVGAGGYIGSSFVRYMGQWPECYEVVSVTTHDNGWTNIDFSGFDTVYFTAGLAHQKETRDNRSLYYAINCALAVAVAQKARTSGVGQFIYLSSMSVYGMDAGIISRETKPNPKSNYGKSKLQAETALRQLESDLFCVAILRPPMVYGKGCKGNFQTVIKIVRLFPFFPQINNQRSMIYVDNLSNFVRLLVDRRAKGLFFPQDNSYMNTADLAQWIAQSLGKPLFMSRLAGSIVLLFLSFYKSLTKAFGTLIYQAEIDTFNESYCVTEQFEAVQKSV